MFHPNPARQISVLLDKCRYFHKRYKSCRHHQTEWNCHDKSPREYTFPKDRICLLPDRCRSYAYHWPQSIYNIHLYKNEDSQPTYRSRRYFLFPLISERQYHPTYHIRMRHAPSSQGRKSEVSRSPA